MPDSTFSKIAIIGLGYVGLPLALQFARSGVTVLGFDKDQLNIATFLLPTFSIPPPKKMQPRNRALPGTKKTARCRAHGAANSSRHITEALWLNPSHSPITVGTLQAGFLLVNNIVVRKAALTLSHLSRVALLMGPQSDCKGMS